MVVLAASTLTEEHSIPTYKLAAFWVDPEMRGQKIGSKIVEESIQWIREDARKNGWKRIRYELGVRPDNYRAVNLYNRLGFSSVSKDSEQDPTSDDGLVEMRLTINIS